MKNFKFSQSESDILAQLWQRFSVSVQLTLVEVYVSAVQYTRQYYNNHKLLCLNERFLAAQICLANWFTVLDENETVKLSLLNSFDIPDFRRMTYVRKLMRPYILLRNINTSRLCNWTRLVILKNNSGNVIEVTVFPEETMFYRYALKCAIHRRINSV